SAPATKPSWTAMVSQELAAAVRLHRTRRSPRTAVAENHVAIAAAKASARRTRLRAAPGAATSDVATTCSLLGEANPCLSSVTTGRESLSDGTGTQNRRRELLDPVVTRESRSSLRKLLNGSNYSIGVASED